MSGPCDEAEHANDPRCTGVAGAQRDDDRRGPNRGPGRGDDDTMATTRAPATATIAAVTTTPAAAGARTDGMSETVHIGTLPAVQLPGAGGTPAPGGCLGSGAADRGADPTEHDRPAPAASKGRRLTTFLLPWRRNEAAPTLLGAASPLPMGTIRAHEQAEAHSPPRRGRGLDHRAAAEALGREGFDTRSRARPPRRSSWRSASAPTSSCST